MDFELPSSSPSSGRPINRFEGLEVSQTLDRILTSRILQMAHQFGYQWNYQRDHFRAVLYLVIRYVELVFFVFIMSSGSEEAENFKWSERATTGISLLWMMVCFQTLGICLILVLGTIRNRFFRLNEQMQTYFNTKFTGRDMMVHSRKNIRRFALMHALLSDSIELFNYCFAKQAMLVLGCALGYTVFAIFGLIHSYAVSGDAVTIRVARINILFTGFYFSFIFQMVVCCHRLHNEVIWKLPLGNFGIIYSYLISVPQIIDHHSLCGRLCIVREERLQGASDVFTTVETPQSKGFLWVV